jgi:hypothetical protein
MILLLVLTLSGLMVSWRIESPEWLVYQGLVSILFASAVTAWVRRRFELRWSWMFLPVLGIVFWPAAQILAAITVYRNATILELLRWTTYGMVFALAFWLFRRSAAIRHLLRVLIIFSLVVAAEATMQHFAGNGKIFWLFPARYAGAAMGPFLNRDHYASFMALILPMAILRAFEEPKRRAIYVLAAASIYASVIAGASRAGSLVVTAEILLCLCLVTIRPGAEVGSRSRRHRFALATVFLIATLVAVVGGETLYDRFMEKDPFQGRRELAIASIAMIRDKPLTGFGAGTWTSVYPGYAIFDTGLFANAAHNDWLQWASDGGVVYAGFFFALFCVSIMISWRVPWAIGIPAVFVHSAIDFPLSDRYLPAALFLIFGAALARWHAPVPGGRRPMHTNSSTGS